MKPWDWTPFFLVAGLCTFSATALAQAPSTNESSKADGKVNTGTETGAHGGPTAVDSTGNENSPSRYETPYFITSSNNVFGLRALLSNMTDYGNSTSGNLALLNNTTGNFDSAAGIAIAAGQSFPQAQSVQRPDPNVAVSEVPVSKPPPYFIPNPQPFRRVGGPHILPKRPPEYFLSPPVAPANAHVTYYGGRVASNLQVVQVIWGSGSFLPQVTSTATPSLATFYQEVLDSSYIDWLSEYDTSGLPAPTSSQIIGRGTFLAQYTITPSTSATTVDDTTVQGEIAAQIASGQLPAPLGDASGNPSTYYAVFFPNGTTITSGGVSSCVSGGFCAYHGTVASNSAHREFFYGVHPDMQAGSGCDLGCGSASTPFGNYTSVASHEMVETITDGEVSLATSYGPPLAWYDKNNGEIADICNAYQSSVVGSDSQTYIVQTEWSNAQGGCVVSGQRYLQVSVPEAQLGVSRRNLDRTIHQ